MCLLCDAELLSRSKTLPNACLGIKLLASRNIHEVLLYFKVLCLPVVWEGIQEGRMSHAVVLVPCCMEGPDVFEVAFGLAISSHPLASGMWWCDLGGLKFPF